MQKLEDIGFGYRPRAAWASDPAHSRGRFYAESVSRTRTPFQRDRDRIIHSTAFRRLKHKTQVFVAHEGDHYRTRLTHTIEVAQIARALARALCLDEDLAEAIALVHDFGHTPFGHTGEDTLNDKMAQWGGFDHNSQSLRIVTKLENRYAEFEGLNLTWETLEGLVKHNGPLAGAHSAGKEISDSISAFDALFPLELSSFASLEAQCAAIADDIAYNAHDIDDGLRSGLLNLEMLTEVGMLGEILDEISLTYPDLDETRIGHELMRRQITQMVEDVIGTSMDAISKLAPKSAGDVRAAESALIRFGDRLSASEAELKAFLFENLYRNEDVMRIRQRADALVRKLFDTYLDDLSAMPESWREGLSRAEEPVRARHVADFLAGMTDTYAINEYRRLFDPDFELG
ncbi:MAG: deoxyguanosinetriphosphate triphosphohydrolase [Rhizobiaceae bacterium]